jgi:hypothetical protein
MLAARVLRHNQRTSVRHPGYGLDVGFADRPPQSSSQALRADEKESAAIMFNELVKYWALENHHTRHLNACHRAGCRN